MKLVIDVTQADIDAGDCTPCGCPVALATTRALRQMGFSRLWQARWEPYNAWLEPDGLTVWRYELGRYVRVCQVEVDDVPHDVYEFALLFDDWREPSQYEPEYEGDEPECPPPFSFAVEVPIEPVAA